MWDHLDVRLANMGRRRTLQGWNIPPRFIENHELVLITKGQGKIMISGEVFSVVSGDLIYFRPGEEHSLWVEEKPYMEFCWMHFWLPPDMDSLPFPKKIHLESTLHPEALFKTMQEIFVQKDYLYEWRQNLLLQQFLCQVYLFLHESQEPMGVRRIRKVLAFIHEDPCRPLTLEDLLQQAGIRKTLFLQSFRKVTGTTPIQYLTGLRLEHARDLLLETNLSVAQIAEQSGFSDPFYFSRCFKKQFAISPRQYRAAHR